VELMQRRRELMTFEHGHWATATGSIATFNTPFAKPLRLLKAEFTPVQEGTGDPSPTNIRPITGWTGVNVYHSGEDTSNPTAYPVTFPAVGKNLLDVSDLQTGVWWNGSILTSYTANKATRKLPIKPNTTYFLKRTSGSQNYCSFFDKDGGFLRQKAFSSNGQSFTTESDEYFIGITLSATDYSTAQLELGSSSTAYEPYTNTVYGGYVDLVKGVLTATHVLVDFKKWTTLGYGAGNGSVWFFSSNYSPALKKYAGETAANASCDKLKVDKYDSFSMKNSNDLRIALDSAGRVRFRYNALSGSEHKEDMYAVLYGLSFIAPLDTPITYQLTPQQITALVSTNNIWSTANGNVTAEYFTR
jgi:hypothetical protein